MFLSMYVLSVCTSLRVYVPLYICSSACMPSPCVGPSECMFLRQYICPLRVYAPAVYVLSCVCPSECIIPRFVCSSVCMSSPCVGPSECMFLSMYAFSVCRSLRVYVPPSVYMPSPCVCPRRVCLAVCMSLRVYIPPYVYMFLVCMSSVCTSPCVYTLCVKISDSANTPAALVPRKTWNSFDIWLGLHLDGGSYLLLWVRNCVLAAVSWLLCAYELLYLWLLWIGRFVGRLLWEDLAQGKRRFHHHIITYNLLICCLCLCRRFWLSLRSHFHTAILVSPIFSRNWPRQVEIVDSSISLGRAPRCTLLCSSVIDFTHVTRFVMKLMLPSHSEAFS